MPYVALQIEPGLFLNKTRYSSVPRWVDGNLIRFRDGTAQQIGGWQGQPLPGATITGANRAMISWRPTTGGAAYLAIGGNLGVWLWNGTTLKVITPTAFVPRAADTTATGEAGLWSFDLWGNILVGVIDGQIHSYDPLVDAVLTPLAIT